MKNIFLLVVLLSNLLVAQQRVSVDLTFEYNDDETYYTPISISQPGLDQGITLAAMEEGYQPIGGFQYVNWFDYHAPIHLEEDDILIVILGKEYDSYNFYYAGDQGAIKNNYLLDRHRYLLELEKDSSFINSSKSEVSKILSEKKDSMMTVVEKLSLSDQFRKDEEQFWDYYTAYHKVFHDVLRNQSDDLTLDEFPELDYDNKVHHYNYRDYLKLSTAYYQLKIKALPDYKTKRDLVKEIDSRTLRYALKSLWVDEIYRRSDDSQDYMALISRFSMSMRAYRQVKKITNKRKRLSIGDPLPLPEVTDYYEKELDLEKAIGKPAFIYLYDPADAQLIENFQIWNQFYVDHRDDGARFLTLGLGSSNDSEAFREFFLELKVAGSHLTTSPKEARKFLEAISIGEAPRIIALDKDWNITDFDVNASLKQRIIFGNNLFDISHWHSDLGKGF